MADIDPDRVFKDLAMQHGLLSSDSDSVGDDVPNGRRPEPRYPSYRAFVAQAQESMILENCSRISAWLMFR